MKALSKAYHEAGHAVVGYITGDKPHVVSIDPAHYIGIPSLVEALIGAGEDVPAEIRDLVVRLNLQRLAAGVAAQNLRSKQSSAFSYMFHGGCGDYKRMCSLALDHHRGNKTLADDMVNAAIKEAHRLVRAHRSQIDSLAAALIEQTTLTGESIIAAIYSDRAFACGGVR
jgi:hypothetical protein